jgi:hypothetical protein
MSAPVPAPLAQLRDADEQLWNDVMAKSTAKPSPGTDTVTQALAAALLGDRPLAVEILRDGIGARSVRPWPKLADPKPVDPDAVLTVPAILTTAPTTRAALLAFLGY